MYFHFIFISYVSVCYVTHVELCLCIRTGSRNAATLIAVHDEVMRSREEIDYIHLEIHSILSYYTSKLEQIRQALHLLNNNDDTIKSTAIDEQYQHINPTAAISLLTAAQTSLQQQLASANEAIDFIQRVSLSFPPLIDCVILCGQPYE